MGGGSGSGGKSGRGGGSGGGGGGSGGMIAAENLPNAYFQRDKLESMKTEISRNYPTKGTPEQQAANIAQVVKIRDRLDKLAPIIKKSESRLTKEARYQVLRDAQFRETTKRKASKDNIRKLEKEGRLYL